MSGSVALTAAVLLSALLCTAVVGLVWRERPKTGSTAMAVTVAMLALWGYGQVIALLASGSLVARVGYGVTFLGTWLVPVTWFVFARQYTGRMERVRWPLIGILAIEPLLLMVLYVSNGAHELVLVDPRFVSDGGRAVLAFDWGPVFWGHMAYAYGLTAVADWYLFEKFLASRNVYRKRTFMFIVFSIPIVGGSAASYLGWSPVPGMALTPLLVLGLSGFFVLLATSDRFISALPLEWVLALVQSRSKSLTPVARERAIEEMPTAFMVLDHENRIVDLNPAARDSIGASSDRLVGRSVTEVVPPEVFRLEETNFFEPNAEGDFTGVWIDDPQGGTRCYDFRLTALTDADGEINGRIALWNEVTDRERRKEAIQRRNTELERQNEQLEEFASIVSHDLRNPLNVAAGRASLLAERLDDEHEAEVATIQSALDRMSELIEDVLAIARSGRTVTDTETVSLEDAARAAWGNVSTTAINLEIRGDRRLEADRTRLYQIFENLFRNAMEHAGMGVTVTVEPTETGFAVFDDGPGVPAEDREAVFDQGYTTTDEGTGFGLAIVRTICEAHGWDVTLVESEDGGARFEISGVETGHRESVPAA